MPAMPEKEPPEQATKEAAISRLLRGSKGRAVPQDHYNGARQQPHLNQSMHQQHSFYLLHARVICQREALVGKLFGDICVEPHDLRSDAAGTEGRMYKQRRVLASRQWLSSPSCGNYRSRLEVI